MDKDKDKNDKPKKHVVIPDVSPTSSHRTGAGSSRREQMNQSPSKGELSYGRRRSIDRTNSEISMGLVSHALHEVVSENIIAGPRGALLTLHSPTPSHDRRLSVTSTITMGLLYLRKTMEGFDIPVDYDDAVAETGHGRFQYKLMATCGFIYSCCSLSTTTLSFVLPAAQTDFNLDSFDKGILNTAPLIGMVLGAYVWGNFADSRGRRFVLLYSLLIDALAAFLSSFCQTFMFFFVCRIFNGFGIIGATSIVFAYLGEFFEHHKRDKYLSRLELFWTFGIIALPVIGFAILPLDWSLGSQDTFLYNSWRMFVFACGLPSLLAALLISRQPESPRFLLLQGKHEKTRQVLIRMFVANTKLLPADYPVKVLNVDKQAEDLYFPKVHGISRWAKIKRIFRIIGKQHRDLFRGRHSLNIFLTCFIDFGLMFVYFTMMLWVPELLHREEQYAKLHDGKGATLCEVEKEHIDVKGTGKVETATFIHTFIVCLACFPTNLVLLFVITYISKKSLLVVILLVTAVPALGLNFVDSEFAVTTMLCLFEAFATLVEAVLFCAIVEIFPINARGTALALTVTVGRIGAVLGNITFGAMIDTHCQLLFCGMSGLLVLTGLSALLLPKMRIGHG